MVAKRASGSHLGRLPCDRTGDRRQHRLAASQSRRATRAPRAGATSTARSTATSFCRASTPTCSASPSRSGRSSTYLLMGVAALVVLRTASASRRRQMATALLLAVGVGRAVLPLPRRRLALRAEHHLCAVLRPVRRPPRPARVHLHPLRRWCAPPAREQAAWQGRTRLIAGGRRSRSLVLLGRGRLEGRSAVNKRSRRRRSSSKDPEFYAWYAKLPTVAPARSTAATAKGRPTPS